jgi:AraC family transcriptional regulator, transcriptional activator of the genes for pyochelin and ferripyochelin receptors
MRLAFMTLVLVQAEYWKLFEQTINTEQLQADEFDTTWKYPEQLGQGFWRKICLREGMTLEIGNYQQLKPFVLDVPDREHPLEYSFLLERMDDQTMAISAGESFFSGSGFALGERSLQEPGEKTLEICIHIEPDVFRAAIGDRTTDDAQSLQHLIRASDQERFAYYTAPTVAMQMTLQQILQCPYAGAVKRLYLESKVWELIALQLELVLTTQSSSHTGAMSTEDVDRIHHAKNILAQQLNDPPSLKTLARQVGLNEFALKQGFRKVLGTTAFGYLHQYRMERARQLLETGEMSITQVARAVGFANRGYFAAAFRKRFGINPKLYSTVAKQAQ